MNLTYKENIADTRETPVKEIIKELKEYGVAIYGYDPLLDNIEQEFGIKPYPLSLITHNASPITAIDGVILAVAHEAFKEITLDKLKTIMKTNPILIDVRGVFDAGKQKKQDFTMKPYRTNSRNSIGLLIADY